MLEALTEYPPYTSPIWRSETKTLQEAHSEYTTYFLEGRISRLEALRRFLAPFEIKLSLEDAGVRAISAWVPLYADLLVDGLQHQENDDIWFAYHRLETPWTGRLLGLNAVFDLGIYMGECLLARNPRLSWLPLVNPEPNNGASHPIFVQSGRRSFDPPQVGLYRM